MSTALEAYHTHACRINRTSIISHCLVFEFQYSLYEDLNISIGVKKEGKQGYLS